MPQSNDPARPLHRCEGALPTEGPEDSAIDACEEFTDGTLWVFVETGGMSQVGYCPYCGFEARTVPTLIMLKRIGA
jgi:hypothetical protein